MSKNKRRGGASAGKPQGGASSGQKRGGMSAGRRQGEDSRGQNPGESERQGAVSLGQNRGGTSMGKTQGGPGERRGTLRGENAAKAGYTADGRSEVNRTRTGQGHGGAAQRAFGGHGETGRVKLYGEVTARGEGSGSRGSGGRARTERTSAPQAGSKRSAALSGLPVEKNGEYTAEIIGIGHDGEGVGRVEGFTLFVPGALPGERVRLKVLKLKKQYGYAKLLEVLESSPDRVGAPCPIFDKCGGCQLQHLDYTAQLKVKRQLVVDNLERIGKLKVAKEADAESGNALGDAAALRTGIVGGNITPASEGFNPADEEITIPENKVINEEALGSKEDADDTISGSGLQPLMDTEFVDASDLLEDESDGSLVGVSSALAQTNDSENITWDNTTEDNTHGGNVSLGIGAATGTSSIDDVRKDIGESTLAAGIKGTNLRRGESADSLKQERERASEADGIVVYPTIGMSDPWRYRNKAQVPFGEEQGGLVGGFYAQGSHRIIDMEACLIQHANNDEVIAKVKEIGRRLGIRAYREETHEGLLRHVVVKVGFRTGEIMVVLVTNGKEIPHAQEWIEQIRAAIPGVASICQNVNTGRTNVIFGPTTRVLWGREVIYDYIGDVKFAISARSFFQVNPVQTEALYGKALEYAGLTGGETVVDAYCGIGTISLFLAKHAKKVYGVEIVPEAIEDAKRNAELNGIRNAEFAVGGAEDVLPEWQRAGVRPDVIVVDPPRKGCDERLLDTILQLRPERIVYVSCNASTLARDLHVLEDGGYRTVCVQPVDMFPHTVHVESVTLMVRK
ncbi:23S rRNA (uracil(1939)-C(5))-methyltransferase RlmD [Paenibacillus chitinolyticus]|uniref:23S rRNA (uracil(1939)-C(5))-methyltransferase RlmD n=1 Tax=Paenibacillus chitinolyticus TaxID=79263 RepID=UPI002DB81BC8|nr:23S rRNA (uracil(1939)-C(5))-methyltransferase RlmD [Paenibacillus chitinolyticus]MEC0246558.1 23S rRNA (uracil(1939)-C(5))-methyltransferase RlmD [Paenibacillus chitinolyticus]